MGRAKGNLIENFPTLPWPAGVVFGVGGFFALRLLPMPVKGNFVHATLDPGFENSP